MGNYIEFLVIAAVSLAAGIWLAIRGNKAVCKWEPEVTPEREKFAIRGTIIIAAITYVIAAVVVYFWLVA